MTQLHISKDLSLPIDAVTQTFAIIAKRGVGKTYTGCVMVEEMLGAGQQVIVADPIGVWWGLRSSADGKEGKFPIVIFGGEHADVPLEENAGEVIAGAIIENGFSAILDLSLLRKAAQVRFMTAFAETLYRLNRKPLHFMVDEADAFAPQRPMPGEQRLLGAFEDIVRRGRARGLGVTLITQRAAVLNKNVLTQIEVLVVLRTISPQDREAIETWTEVHGTKKQLEQLSESMASLPIGTAWFWSPGWLDVFQKVQVRKRITFDSSSTPKVGEKIVAPKEIAPVDLDKLGQQIKSTAEKAKANDPAALRRQIKELEHNLSVKVRDAVKAREAVEVKEVAALSPANMRRLGEVVSTFESLQLLINKTDERIASALAGLVPEIHFFKAILLPTKIEARRASPERPLTVRPAAPPRVIFNPQRNGDASLGKCERALLSVLAQFPEGCNRKKLILLAGYCWSGSTQNALGKLRGLGLVEGSNSAVMRITDAGRREGPFPELPTGDDLLAHWLAFPHFGKCERELLRVLSEHPEGLDRDKLLELSGYEWSGSTQNALGALRTAEVITGRNNEIMRLSDELLAMI